MILLHSSAQRFKKSLHLVLSYYKLGGPLSDEKYVHCGFIAPIAQHYGKLDQLIFNFYLEVYDLFSSKSVI